MWAHIPTLLVIHIAQSLITQEEFVSFSTNQDVNAYTWWLWLWFLASSFLEGVDMKCCLFFRRMAKYTAILLQSTSSLCVSVGARMLVELSTQSSLSKCVWDAGIHAKLISPWLHQGG